MIPKTIFQIFLGFEPRKHWLLQDKINKMFRVNSMYEHIMITDEEQMSDFVEQKYDNTILESYNKLADVYSKIEFFKYLVLYEYGGIYLDTSKTITKDLDEFITDSDSAIITVSSSPGLYLVDTMFFEPRHPILEKVIQLIKKYIDDNTYNGDFDDTVGPKLFTKAIKIMHFTEYNKTVDLVNIKKDDELKFVHPQLRYRIYGIEFENICDNS